jgi:hypothetical protein
MAVSSTWAVTSVLFNSITYTATDTGGPIGCSYRHGGQALQDWTGDSVLPTAVDIVDQACEVRVRMRDVKQALVLGTKATLTLTIAKKGGTVALSFVNMVLVEIAGSQNRSQRGEVELVFAHESANGTTAPMS